jgi:hypothetical protein
LHDLICHASRNPFALRVKEHQLDGVAVSALRETGFIPDGGEWWRSSFRGLITAEQLLEKLQDTLIPKALKEKVFTYIRSASRSPGATLEIERILGPGKIKDGFVPAYVVSIRPEWAAHFFDIPVGGQLLMDLKEKLHLGIEGAYYCSSNNTHVSAPARILWYVSKGRSGIGSMEVKACSTLEEVVIDKPKEVFSRFKRLGVYEWNHVFETARSSVERDVMALRFSRTERFKIPVTLQELQKLGVPDPQNPRRITPEQFDAIYARGMELKQQE